MNFTGHVRLFSVVATALLAGACGGDSATSAAEDAPKDATDISSTDDIDPQDDADSATNDAEVSPGLDSADPQQPLQVINGATPEGYLPGGLIATYYAGTAQSPDALPEQPALVRVHPDLNLSESNAAFQTVLSGEPFTVVFEGGLNIAAAGTYRLAVTAADSVRVKLGGTTVVEAWAANETLTLEQKVTLEKGWYPLEVTYARTMFKAHLQLWLEAEEQLIQPVASEQLGISETPPSEALEAKMVLGDAIYYSAPLTVTANAPVTLQLIVNDDPVDWPSMVFMTEHHATVPLLSGHLNTVVLTVKDVWSRTHTFDVEQRQTQAVPDYTAGFILGHYYNETTFEGLATTRLDERINYPDDADGDNEGSFASGMEPYNLSIRWEGGLWIETAGDYIIHWGTDDGQRMWLDGAQVVDLWVGHGLAYVDVPTYLSAGWHPLILEMFQGNGGVAAKLEWTGPNFLRETIPGKHLGAEVPAQPSEAPKVEELTAKVDADKGTVRVTWSTNKLCSAALTIDAGEWQQSVTLPGWSNGFSYKFSGVAPAKGTASVVCTDLKDTSSPSVSTDFDLPAK